MPLIAGQEGNAIYCKGDYGPTFGGGHDLKIASQQNQYALCSVNLNNSYQCPTGQNKETFLTGNRFFLVNEIEVFGLDN